MDKFNILIAARAKHTPFKNLALVSPFGIVTNHWLVLINVLLSCEEDFSDPNIDLLNELAVGDLIQIDGKRVCFGGIRETDRGRSIGFYETGKKGKAGPCYTWLSEKDIRGRIAPYAGMAKNPQRFTGKKARAAIGHNLFAALHGINEFQPNIKTSSLVITEKKSYIEELQNLEIHLAYDVSTLKFPFCEAIPAAAYSTNNKFSRIAAKKNDNRPLLLKIVSSPEVGIELCQNDKNIQTVIIDGESKILRNFLELKRIKEIESVKNIYIILSNNIDQKSLRELQQLGFFIWKWNEEFILSIGTESLPDNRQNGNIDTGAIQNKLISNLLNKTSEMVEVDYPSKEAKALINEYSEILFYLKDFIDEPHAGEIFREFICQGYGYRSFILSPLAGLPSCHDRVNRYIEQLKLLIPVLKELNKATALHQRLDRLAIAIDRFKDLFCLGVNQKNEMIKKHLHSERTGIGLVLKNLPANSVLDEFGKFIGKGLSYRFLKLSDLKSFHPFDSLLFTGWLGSNHPYYLNCPLAPKHLYFLYDIEKKIYEIMQSRQQLHNFPEPLERVAALLDLTPSEVLSLAPSLAPSNLASVEEFVKNKREVNLNDLYDAICSKRIPSYSGTGEIGEELLPSKCIFFEDDQYGFFSENYIAKVLDRSKEEVIDKDLSVLAEGDELLFLEDSKRDLFQVMAIELHKKMPDRIEEAKIWRDSLKRLKTEKNYSVEKLNSVLRENGVIQEISTLKGWVSDKEMIAPQSLDRLIDVLSTLLNDATIGSKKKLIITACRRIRASHNILGRYLAKQLIGSFNKGANTVQQDLAASAEELRKHVYTLQINKLSDDVQAVPVSILNKVFEL